MKINLENKSSLSNGKELNNINKNQNNISKINKIYNKNINTIKEES